MNIVAVFAHPDDESFIAGGTLALLAQDHNVQLICATDGNHQEKNLKQVREKELQSAAKILGIQKVHQLNYSDGGLCNANYHALAADVRNILDNVRPERIYTFHPNGLSGHLDHIAVTSVVNYLFHRLDYIHQVYYFSAAKQQNRSQHYFVYQPDGLDLTQIDQVVNVESVWDKKISAISAHVSQSADGQKIISDLQNAPKQEYLIVTKK